MILNDDFRTRRLAIDFGRLDTDDQIAFDIFDHAIFELRFATRCRLERKLSAPFGQFQISQ